MPEQTEVTVITSNRLVLRPMASKDRETYVGLYTDPGVMQFIGAPLTEERASRSFDEALAQQASQAGFAPRWIIHAPDSDDGQGLLAIFADVDAGCAEIGVMVLPKAQGRRLGVEALEAMIHAVFGAGWVQAIRARHLPGHQATRWMLETLGFPPGETRQGECRWSITRQQWAGRGQRDDGVVAPPNYG